MTDRRVSAALIRDLARVVGPDGVVENPEARAVYECDGYTLERAVPDLVVLPRSTDEVARVLAGIHAAGCAVVPRGAGTSLAGGCLAPSGSVVVALTRMRAVEVLDGVNRQARIQAGVVNEALSRAALPEGLHYAPDPSSQQVCSIGGNIANNSGGPHTLKYGVTVNHVLAVELVTPEGKVRWLGSRVPARGGPDLAGIVVGSEGTFGIVTRAWVKLVPPPPGVRTLVGLFGEIEEASRAVSSIIASGIVPAALEMMDALTLDALRRAFGMEFPPGAEALLLIEVDGLEPGLDHETAVVSACCRDAGAFEVRQAGDERERIRLWMARKRAFGAFGRLSRNYCTQDGVVPRTRLPEILKFIQEVGEESRIRIANVFHAGDGNLHPVLLYDERNAEEVERVLEASARILERCLDLGGSLTGEHGIGVEKLALMDRAFSADTLDAMQDVRRVFDPDGRANPDKAVPAGGGCSDPIPPGGKRRTLARTRPGRQAPQ
jgi:glycolate oxidase